MIKLCQELCWTHMIRKIQSLALISSMKDEIKNIPLEMQTQDRQHGMWTRIEILMNNKISVFPTGQLMTALKKMGFLANSLNNLVIIQWGALKQLLRKFLWLIFHSKEKWDHRKPKYISTGKWLYLPFFPLV